MINLLNYKLAACIEVEEAILFADVPRMRRAVEAQPNLPMPKLRIRSPPRRGGLLQHPHHRRRGRHATGLLRTERQCILSIRTSILAPSQVVVRAPRKWLGSNPEKPPGLSPIPFNEA